MAKYSVNDAVWIATALMAAEKYSEKSNLKRADMYFKQSDIVRRAQTLTESKVEAARVSQWTNADYEKHTKNYLRADLHGNKSLRRLSMMDEFLEKTFPENLEMMDELLMGGEVFTMEELFFFVREQYPFIIEGEGYWPSLDNYNPGLSKRDWIEILSDNSITIKEDLKMFWYMLLEGGASTCANLAEKYGGTASSYNMRGSNYGKKVSKARNIQPCVDGKDLRYFPIPFIGKYIIENNKKRYLWKLRNELKEALEEMDLSNTDMRIASTVNYDKNMILYGPPGTGKTYSTAKYAVAICDGNEVSDLNNYSAVMKRYRELMKEHRISFVTFHQSYGYEEFIEGIKPVLKKDAEQELKSDNEDGDIKYGIIDGVFKSFCNRARISTVKSETEENKKDYVFVIDEINRGNISKIFGELITLIEDTKREGLEECIPAILPYSGDEFTVPNNVYILGTMNTADRSIALMDTALRRRFKFKEMLPDYTLLKGVKVELDSENVDIGQMLKIINDRIIYLYDREHTIGHAIFMGLVKDNSIKKLASIFAKSVIPLLQEYFYEDYEKIRLVLGDNAKKDKNTQFIIAEDIPNDIFEGDISDEIDIPEKHYTIKYDNFENIMAYKGISKKL